MKDLVKGKFSKLSVSFLAVFTLVFGIGFAAMADTSSGLVLDNYNRTTLSDFSGSGVGAQWTGGNAGGSAKIVNNALVLNYGSQGWFGTGGAIDASKYKYLVIRIKGAKGGEGSDFDLNYAVGSTVKQTGKTFSQLLSAPGKKVPAITTNYQNIVIDLAANNFDKRIQALHFNFNKNVSGTLYIDNISFTNNLPSAASTSSSPSSSKSSATTQPANPKTGDHTPINLYDILAVLSGIAVVGLSVRARKLNKA